MNLLKRGAASASGPTITSASAAVDGVLDHLLQQLQCRRERVQRTARDANSAARVAELYEHEARLWSLWFEQSERRLQWRAALGAEAHARASAHAWRARAQAYWSFAGSCGNTSANGVWSR